jgi:hypothetical protein
MLLDELKGAAHTLNQPRREFAPRCALHDHDVGYRGHANTRGDGWVPRPFEHSHVRLDDNKSAMELTVDS